MMAQRICQTKRHNRRQWKIKLSNL